MSDFAEKVRSIGTSFHKGTSKITRVVDDRDGSTAGKTVEHWDDRTDATAMPKTIKYRLRATEEA